MLKSIDYTIQEFSYLCDELQDRLKELNKHNKEGDIYRVQILEAVIVDIQEWIQNITEGHPDRV